MNEVTMPAAEAAVDTTDEVVSYELAFHVLPTVAEGEVDAVVSQITTRIAEAGGTVGLQENAQRFTLAYELTKMIDGKYRHFDSSYFGWVRFTALPHMVEALMNDVEAMPEMLRALLVRLTRAEEAHPFYLHESLQSRKDSHSEVESDESEPEDSSEETEAPAEPTEDSSEEAITSDIDEK